ncbi:MAG: sensor histidine kinase [Gammaproteobacteria bacterium]|nr:sensor histidine kinase [Gammaproteobacteria bacterium]
MRSLKLQLSSGLLLSLLLVFLALWYLISSSINTLMEDYIASRLEHDIDNLIVAINIDAQNNIAIDDQAIGAIFRQPFSGHYYTIQTENNTLYSRSLWDQKLTVKPLNTGQQQRYYVDGPEQQKLLALSKGVQKQDLNLVFTVAEDLSAIEQGILHFSIHFGKGTALLLLLIIAIQLLILNRILKPLQTIQQDLRGLQQGENKQLDNRAPSELVPLVKEINHLLKVTEQRLDRSRNSLGDLAHAIKKPLTLLRQLLSNQPDLSRQTPLIEQQLTIIQQLTDRTLKRARLAGQGPAGALFSFDADLAALIHTLQAIHHDRHIQFSCHKPEHIQFALDRQDISELLGNLLDNAFKWARHQVQLTIDSTSGLNIYIEDDGPGIAPQDIEQLKLRGTRLDESIEGHGLGLAISSDIIDNYEGTMTFSRSNKLGGLRVSIQLLQPARTGNV